MTASAEKDSRREAGSRSVRSDDLPAEPQKSGLLTEAFSQTAALTMIWDLSSRSFYISHVQDPVFYLSAAKKPTKNKKGNWFVFDLISKIKCWSKSWQMNLVVCVKLIFGMKSNRFYVNKSCEKTKTNSFWLPVCRSQLLLLLEDINP